MMKKDIKDATDIRLLIDSFYEKVKRDPVIGYIFTDVAKVDWDHHLPIMYSFWESTLFMKAAYAGNPMVIHVNLNRKTQSTKIHFDRWVELFEQTVDALFEGEMAERAKQRARSIATIMQIKIAGSENKGSVVA